MFDHRRQGMRNAHAVPQVGGLHHRRERLAA